MHEPALSIAARASQAVPLAAQIPVGRLVELSGDRRSARFHTAIAILCHAQAEGEIAAWVKRSTAPLFPPDLESAGVDLDSLVVASLSTSAGDFALPRAAELLLRSGGFGLVIIDLSLEGAPARRGDTAWQGRLLSLARQHRSRVVLITTKPATCESLGPLISLRVDPHRERKGSLAFTITPAIVKDKSGLLTPPALETVRGPWGLW